MSLKPLKLLYSFCARGVKCRMRTNRDRILAISPLPPPYGGFANNMALYLSSSLTNDYDFVCLNLSASMQREKNPDRPSFVTALYAILVIFKLIYLLLKNPSKLVYIKVGTQWGFFRDIIIIIITKLVRKKLVCHLHSKSSGTLFLDNSSLRQIFCWCMYLPDKIIVLSELLKKEFSPLIRLDKLEVINNIVDTSIFTHQNEVRSKNLYHCRPVIRILFVGRLTQKKGIFDLLDTVPLIVSQYKNVKFELAGAAETEQDENEIRKTMISPSIRDYVNFLGIINGSEKIETFMNADVFFFPTHLENMPNVILEAFAAGLPIITTNVGQIPYMIEDGVNGFIVERGNIKGFAERLIMLIESSELRERMSLANHKKAREIYDVEIGAEKMRQIFDGLLLKGDR